MTKRIALLSLALLLAACQNNGALKAPAADTGPRDKNAPLTETATPNKPATKEAADVENEDLESLKAELNALNSDLSKMRNDLAVNEATNAPPPEDIAVPRSLATNGIVDIPDSKIELQQAYQAQITGARVGQHPDKTRLVMDMDGSINRNPDVSLSSNTLKIKFFGTDWPGSAAQIPSLEAQLGVIKVVKEKDDTLVTITLKKPATLKSDTVLPAAAPGGPERLVVDLAPAS